MVRTLCSYCQGPRFDPWLRNEDSACPVAWQKKKKMEQILERENMIPEFKTSLDALNMEMEMTKAEPLRLGVINRYYPVHRKEKISK